MAVSEGVKYWKIFRGGLGVVGDFRGVKMEKMTKIT